MNQEEHLKRIIALVFIKGYDKEENKSVGSKSKLAKRIVTDKEFHGRLTPKRLADYHRYFFGKAEKYSYPNDNTMYALLKYINFESLAQFEKNKPSNEDYLNKVPFDESNDSLNEDKEYASSPSIKDTPKSNTFMLYFLFSILGVIVLAIIFVLADTNINIINKKDETSPLTIKTESFIVNNSNRVYPNQNTDFFDKNNNPKLWYVLNDANIEFYDKSGELKKTGQKLKPVNEEIVKTYYINNEGFGSKDESNEDISSTNTPSEIEHQKETPFIHPKNRETNIYIFDSEDKIDRQLTNHIKSLLKKDGYNFIPQKFSESDFDKQTVSNLKNFRSSIIDINLNDHIQFLCVGTVEYHYRDNKILKDKVTCEIQIEYSIVSLKTNQEIETFSKTIIGNGSTKETAKNNTIKKLIL